MSLSKLAEKYFHFGLRLIGLEKSLKFSVIDFERPWLAVVLKRWPIWLFILSGRVIASAFIAGVPIYIGYSFEQADPIYFLILFLAWLAVEGWRYITVFVFDVEQSRVTYGIHYSAYRFFLTVDPIYHAMRTSGKLFAKIERGAHAYEDIMHIVIYDILAVVTTVVFVVISFLALNITVGLISFFFLFGLLAFNILAIWFNSISFESQLIKADDAMKSISMESLVRIELVRSSFATEELHKSIRKKNRRSGAILATHWISFATVMLITRIVYGISVCVLSLYVLSMMKAGIISTTMGAAFLATYLGGSKKIMRIGDRVQKLLRSVIRVKDLFAFVEGFGQQTFPVLAVDTAEKNIPELDTISVQVHDLNFAYTKKAQIFEEHNLDISVPKKQENKLYGIIGPSGIGKTTLISILGGQLRPSTGTVKINGMPMYDINDETRQQLVAVQGQAASNLSGTVRDSLLLGLPKDRDLFPDHLLIDLLKRVGVWKIFNEKEGIDSAVGEGGMNLSVGQRQRLNFASLYLRTTYFKPLLILIDEPTSSLDEVSEQAITDMIDELAKDSVTLVIAHRLHTIEKAVGILDVSLLTQEKDLIFHTRTELEEKSEYYRKLIGGEVAIEE